MQGEGEKRLLQLRLVSTLLIAEEYQSAQHYTMKPRMAPKKNKSDLSEITQMYSENETNSLPVCKPGILRVVAFAALLASFFQIFAVLGQNEENPSGLGQLKAGIKEIGAQLAGSDFHTLVQDASGVAKGDPVWWKGARVGSVTGTSSQDGRVRIDVDLSSEFEGGIPSDVKAWATSGFWGIGSSSPRLLLVRLKFQKAETVALKDGATVPEARMYEALPYRQITWLAFGLLILFIIFSLIKGIYKLAVRLIVILVLLTAGYVGWNWWQGKIDTPVEAAESVRDMGRLLSERMKAFARDHLGKEDLKATWTALKETALDKLKNSQLTPEEKQTLIQSLMDKKSELDPDKYPDVMEELNQLLGSLKEE